MSRVFSLPTILRMVPNDLLARFFDSVGHPLPIPWGDLGPREVGPILEQIQLLPPGEQDRVEAALRNVFDLACDAGVAALVEAAGTCQGLDLAPLLPPDAGPYHRAMWACLEHPGIVERALLIHQVEHLPWWRKRNDLPRVAPPAGPDALHRLEAALSDLFLREQGRGRRCTVEALCRRGTHYYFAHPDDFVQCYTAHDDHGRLEARSFRCTFLVAFAFAPADGILELYARVPAKLKPLLEEAFAQAVLGVDLDDWQPGAAYALNALKWRRFSLATDPADALRVRLRRLRLAVKNTGWRIDVEANPARGEGDIYDLLDQVLDRERAPLSLLNVVGATFRFEFLAQGDRRAGSVTFDVAYPSACSLRNQHPERLELIQKYLTRWRIDVSRAVDGDLAAAG